MTPPPNRRAADPSYERVPDAVKLAVKQKSTVNSSTAPISVAQARDAGYCDVPLESISATTATNLGAQFKNNNSSNNNDAELQTIAVVDNRRPSATASPYEAAPRGLSSVAVVGAGGAGGGGGATSSSSGGYASVGVVSALAATRRYQAGPASLAPSVTPSSAGRLSELQSTPLLLAALNAHAKLSDATDDDDRSDADALFALPQATLLELLWAAFESHAMAATRGIYRLVTLARSSSRLAARLPQLLLSGDKSACAAELAAKCRAIEPLVAIVGVAAQQDLFARVADVLSSASVISFASERVVGAALRALKVESPRLFSSVWLKVSNDLRKRIQQLIEAHSKMLYDRSLRALICFDEEPQTTAAPARPQLQRQSSTLLLTDQHSKMLARVARFSPQELSAALRRNVLLAESGTHSDDDDDDDIDVDANPYDRAPPDLKRTAAEHAAAASASSMRRTSVLDLALLDVDSSTATTTTSSGSGGGTYQPISYNEATVVWTANDVRAAGGSNNTLDNDQQMVAQVRQLRARVRSELHEVSADEFAAMPSSAPLTRIFQLHVVDKPVDVVSLVDRLREASTRGGTQFVRMCGDALRALSLSDLDALVGELEPNDAKWLLDMAGAETRRALQHRRRE
jgi:hypothetical protein